MSERGVDRQCILTVVGRWLIQVGDIKSAKERVLFGLLIIDPSHAHVFVGIVAKSVENLTAGIGRRGQSFLNDQSCWAETPRRNLIVGKPLRCGKSDLPASARRRSD